MAFTYTQPLYGDVLREIQPVSRQGTYIAKIPGQVNKTPYSLAFSQELLSKHCLLLGCTGSGKTNFIYHLISQIKPKLSKDDVMIVFDTKGDYLKKFHADSDAVISNNSTHQNVVSYWNIYREAVADGWNDSKIVLNANEIAWDLFQESIERNGNQPFFPKAARDLFAAILIHFLRIGGDDRAFKVKYYNNNALKRFFDVATPEKVNSILKSDPDLAAVRYYLGEKDNNQGLGVFAELQQTVRNIFIGAFAGNGSFSVRDFVRKKGGRTLFIEYDLTAGGVLTPIYRLLIDLALKEAMGTEHAKGNVYVICDEFKLLPYLQHMEDAVNFGRSMGVKVVAGLQSMSQLYELYGESQGRSIAAGFSTVISFHLNDVISRDYIQDLYGKNLILEQYSLSDNTLVEDKRQGHTVEDWDISSLRVGEAIVGLPFEKPFRFQVAEYK